MKMKQQSKKFLILGLFLFGVTLILWNCTIEDHKDEPVSIDLSNVKTVSFKDAIAHFNFRKEQIELKRAENKETTDELIITPDWNTLKFNSIAYTDANLTTANAEINRDGKYSSQLYFINVNNHIRNVVFTIYKDKVDDSGNVINGRIFFNALNGKFLDGYIIEEGVFTKQYKVQSRNQIQKASFLSLFLLQEDSDEIDFSCWVFSDGSLDEIVVTAHLSTNNGESGGGGHISSSMDPSEIYRNYINEATYSGPASSAGPGLSSSQVTSAAAAILMAAPVDPDEDGKCPEGYKKNPITDKCDPICTGGKIYDSATKECSCPKGKTEDDKGNCVDDCNTSKEDLKKVFPSATDDRLKEIADAINKYGRDFGIDNKEKLQHFLAQAGHESDNFKTFSEYTNYQVKRLHLTFKKHFNPYSTPTKDKNKQNPKDYEVSEGSKYAKAEKLYNFVYNDKNRGKGYKLGNTETGDGYKFRGRGIFQLTGRANYKKFNDFYRNKYDKNKNMIDNPELIATDKTIAVISALWFYNNKINITIDSKTTVESVTKKVNGGSNGIKDRKSKFTKAKTNIDCK